MIGTKHLINSIWYVLILTKNKFISPHLLRLQTADWEHCSTRARLLSLFYFIYFCRLLPYQKDLTVFQMYKLFQSATLSCWREYCTTTSTDYTQDMFYKRGLSTSSLGDPVNITKSSFTWFLDSTMLCLVLIESLIYPSLAQATLCSWVSTLLVLPLHAGIIVMNYCIRLFSSGHWTQDSLHTRQVPYPLNSIHSQLLQVSFMTIYFEFSFLGVQST